MNEILQNSAVLLFFLGAIGFLIKKFFWKQTATTNKETKSCGSDGCGCH